MNKKLLISLFVVSLIVVAGVVAYTQRGTLLKGKIPTKENLDLLPEVAAAKSKTKMTISAKIKNGSLMELKTGKSVKVKFFVNGIEIPELTRMLNSEIRPGMEVEFFTSIPLEFLQEKGTNVTASGEYKIAVEIDSGTEEAEQEKGNNKAETTVK